MSKPTIPLTPGKYFHIYNRGINSCPTFHDDVDHERFLYLYGKYVGPVADTLAWVLMRTHIHFLLRIKEDVVYRYSLEELKQMEAAQRTNAARSAKPASPPRDATGFCPPPEDALSFAKWETVSISTAGRQYSGRSAEEDARERFPDVSGCGQDSGKAGFVDVSGCDRQDTDVSGGKASTNKTPNPSAHLGHLFNAYARYFNLKYRRHGSLFVNKFKRKPVEDEKYLRNVVVYIHKNPEHHSFYADFSKYPWSSYHSCFTDQPVLINKSEVLEWFGGIAHFVYAHKGQMSLHALDEWLEE